MSWRRCVDHWMVSGGIGRTDATGVYAVVVTTAVVGAGSVSVCTDVVIVGCCRAVVVAVGGYSIRHKAPMLGCRIPTVKTVSVVKAIGVNKTGVLLVRLLVRLVMMSVWVRVVEVYNVGLTGLVAG